jgi:hypothetical protein
VIIVFLSYKVIKIATKGIIIRRVVYSNKKELLKQTVLIKGAFDDSG